MPRQLDPQHIFKSHLYDVLYETADQILKRHSPCIFENGKCLRKMDCCEACPYISGHGCTVKALSCKLWLCDDARQNKPQCAAALDALSMVAQNYGLYGFRMRKKDVLSGSFF